MSGSCDIKQSRLGSGALMKATPYFSKNPIFVPGQRKRHDFLGWFDPDNDFDAIASRRETRGIDVRVKDDAIPKSYGVDSLFP